MQRHLNRKHGNRPFHGSRPYLVWSQPAAAQMAILRGTVPALHVPGPRGHGCGGSYIDRVVQPMPSGMSFSCPALTEVICVVPQEGSPTARWQHHAPLPCIPLTVKFGPTLSPRLMRVTQGQGLRITGVGGVGGAGGVVTAMQAGWW